MSPLLIGTAGYSYDDWCGLWYPPSLPKGKMLDYYADYFGSVEINATYYRTPTRKSAEGMVRSARGRILFTIKVPGDVTHKRMLSPEVLQPYFKFLEPFGEDNTLAALLLQFPNAFRAVPATWEYLKRAQEEFRGFPLVGEFRHSSWDTAEADKRLEEMQISRVILDQPDVRGLSASERVVYTGPIPYYRFHGRNAADWYSDEPDANRYRYRYTEQELLPWVPILKPVSKKAETAFAFFNNHPDGAAPDNAQMLMRMLDIPVRRSPENDLFGPTV